VANRRRERGRPFEGAQAMATWARLAWDLHPWVARHGPAIHAARPCAASPTVQSLNLMRTAYVSSSFCHGPCLHGLGFRAQHQVAGRHNSNSRLWSGRSLLG